MADDEAETPIETAPEAPATVAVPTEPAALDVVPAAEAGAEAPTAEAKRERKSTASPAEAIAPADPAPVEPAPGEPAAVAADAPVLAAPAKPVPRPRKAPVKTTEAKATVVKATPAKVALARPVVARPAVKPARKIAAAKAPVAKTTQRKASASAVPAKINTVTTPKNNIVRYPTFSQLKEKLMAKIIPTEFTAPFQTAFSDIQEKAKSAYGKSTEALGEAHDFAKGNVEALVESGKLLASGLQELGSSVATDSKSAFETIAADVKELAAVKSPAEFFQLQSTLFRKTIEGAVVQASKNTEAMMKLATEAFTPLSSRVSLAVEKVSKAA